jgi:hypothetical protein
MSNEFERKRMHSAQDWPASHGVVKQLNQSDIDDANKL